jgi:hypothetical protein
MSAELIKKWSQPLGAFVEWNEELIGYLQQTDAETLRVNDIETGKEGELKLNERGDEPEVSVEIGKRGRLLRELIGQIVILNLDPLIAFLQTFTRSSAGSIMQRPKPLAEQPRRGLGHGDLPEHMKDFQRNIGSKAVPERLRLPAAEPDPPLLRPKGTRPDERPLTAAEQARVAKRVRRFKVPRKLPDIG